MNNIMRNVPHFTEEEIEKIRKQAEEKYEHLGLPEKMARKIARLIVLQFEDLLNYRCTELPNPYKSDDRLHETPGITNIYGDDYDDLVDSVSRILLRFCKDIGTDNLRNDPPKYKGYIDFGEETEYPYFGFTQEQLYNNPAYLEDMFECQFGKDLWFHIEDEYSIHLDKPGFTWRDMQELYKHAEEMRKSKESGESK